MAHKAYFGVNDVRSPRINLDKRPMQSVGEGFYDTASHRRVLAEQMNAHSIAS